MAINEFKVAQTFKKYYGNVIKKRVADAPKFKVILKIRRKILEFGNVFRIGISNSVDDDDDDDDDGDEWISQC